jgi:hypothetical protein
MPNWSHCKKEVRKALNDAVTAGFEVKESSGRGHSWGHVYCTVCSQRQAVWSTPADQDVHADQIRRFMRRHGQHDAQ